MSESPIQQAILAHLRDGAHLTLFLDYDGTLVPIAPTPEQALPDAGLLELLAALSNRPALRTAILSGRPLASLRSLFPIRGLVLGGLYGMETQIDGQTIRRGPPQDEIRSSIAVLANQWQDLSRGLDGFLVEDKGQAVALHARWAEARQAERVISDAQVMAHELTRSGSFRILDGNRFLEVAPLAADKGESAEWFLTTFPVEQDMPISFGDDNKDEAVFAVVQRRGGFAIGVGDRYPLPGVDERLQSPSQVREWLRLFANP